MKRSGLYSKKVFEHFQNPHNTGQMKNPDGVGKVGSLICGDVMWLYIKVAKNSKGEDIIKDVKFETYGCLAAIASSSVLTDLIKGKTIKEALSFDRRKIVDSLGGLPPIKMHCSVLAADALVEAVYDYLRKNNKPVSEELRQKHKELEKEKKEIEKRHKEWTELEESLHRQKAKKKKFNKK